MNEEKDDIIQRFFKGVFAIRRAAIEDFQYKLGEPGVSHAEVLTLLVISKNPRVTARELADKLMVTPGFITQNIDALEKAGLVERLTSQTDRRVQHVALTKLGAEKSQVYAEYHQKLRAQLAEHIGSEDLEAMNRILDKMSSFFKEKSHQHKQEKA